MQVKTRYNRGDKVYLIREKEIVEGVVASIEVFVKKLTAISYQIKYPWCDAIENTDVTSMNASPSLTNSMRRTPWDNPSG